MARLHASIPPPTQSVLDRLIDYEPDDPEPEAQLEYARGLAVLRDQVLRDLEWILNARTSHSVPIEGSAPDDPLQGTVVRLGLPDITNVDLKNAREREFLRRSITDAIGRFEPRLDFVSVAIGEGAGHGRTRFQIQARLKIDPEPLKLSFDATVVWRDRRVTVR